MPKKLICVGGARPNFMKLAPLIQALISDEAFHPVFVHTGQHYDQKMSGQFFGDLGMPEPDYSLAVGSGTHSEQTAEVMKRFEPVVLRERPHAVLVVGDVNSTMACAIVAAKLNAPVVHVEAGLRSFDRTMPEEINRIVTDAVSAILLVTEESGRRNLLAEGIPSEHIHLVGNLMIDTLFRNLARARDSDVIQRLQIPDGRFGLVTLHRPANVDDAGQLLEILEALATISLTVPLYFPVHPRTRQRLEGAALPAGSIRFLDPLGYLDFLCLMSKSAIVLTDSGGVQEETTALGIPCLTLRNNTERPITIEQGTNLLAGTHKDSILAAWQQVLREPKIGRTPPMWDGKTAQRCVDVLKGALQDKHIQPALC